MIVAPVCCCRLVCCVMMMMMMGFAWSCLTGNGERGDLHIGVGKISLPVMATWDYVLGHGNKHGDCFVWWTVWMFRMRTGF